MALAEQLAASVDEAPEDAPPEMQKLAGEARALLRSVTDIMAAPTEAAGFVERVSRAA
jgi:hypothetical protein